MHTHILVRVFGRQHIAKNENVIIFSYLADFSLAAKWKLLVFTVIFGAISAYLTISSLLSFFLFR